MVTLGRRRRRDRHTVAGRLRQFDRALLRHGRRIAMLRMWIEPMCRYLGLQAMLLLNVLRGSIGRRRDSDDLGYRTLTRGCERC